VSGSALEHDSNWRLTIRKIFSVLVPGGLLVVAAATHGHPEHGTARTNPKESPGTSSLGHNHYANVSVEDFRSLIDDLDVAEFEVWHNPKIFDLYAVVTKASSSSVAPWVFPSDKQVSAIVKSTPMMYQMARWPIRFGNKIFGVRLGAVFGRYWWKALASSFPTKVRGS